MEDKETAIIEKVDENRTYIYFKDVNHNLLQRLFAGGSIYVKKNYAFPGEIQLHADHKSIVVVKDDSAAKIVLELYKDWIKRKKED